MKATLTGHARPSAAATTTTCAPGSLVWLLLVCQAALLFCLAGSYQAERRGPVFVHEPPRRVDFSNSTGATVACAATGSPEPRVTWTTADGSSLEDVRGLRYARPNGSLVLPPFRAEDYRQDVHATVYRCAASNPVGAVVSRDVHVRAVVRQKYAAEVYDEFVISGNTAVMRCQVPGYVTDYVTVTSWIEEPTGNVIKPGINSGSTKYQMFPEGELYIRDVDKSFSYRSYRCQTRDKLTGESTRNSLPGRLIVTETHTGVPPRIIHSRQKITASVGDAVSLPCAAHGSPPPQYRWYREDGGLVFLDQRTSLVDGVLFVRKAAVGDAGKYTCVANNSAGEDRVTTELVVTEPLGAHIQPARQQVRVGQPITIRCSVSGHPVAGITWRFNQRTLALSDRVALLSADALDIRSVHKEDRGMYQCFVHNDVDSVQASFELALAEDLPQFQETFGGETVQAGTRLSLKCSASGNPLPQITWSLDDAPVPETHRVRFGDYVTQFGVVVSYLNFSLVQVEDGGEYRCTANNGVGTLHHAARINVPGRPVVRSMRNLTVVAGETLSIVCPVAGYPLESINWERAGVRLPYNHRQKVHDNGSLEVYHMERATDEGPYTCVAKDKEGHSAQSTVYISVKVKPAIEPFSYPSSLREGQRASVMCAVISGDLPINISWTKDGEFISESNPDTAGILVNTVSGFTSTLLFKSLRLEYRGNYTCVAQNEAGSASHSAVMVIHVPPQWVIEPAETSVIKGKSVVIDCEADGFPKPRIRWTKAEGDAARDFKPVMSSAHVQVFENGSLAINDAKEEDAGFFLCQASNGIGQGLSKVVKVTVHIAAHFKTKFAAEMVRKGQTTRLKCDAIGDKPMGVSWMKDKQPVSPKQDPRYELVETVQATGITSEIIIRQTDRRDSALFTCVATNNFGQDDTNIQLIIQEPPDAPQDLKVVETSSRSVKLEWTAPYSGNSAITHYTVQYKDDGSKWHAKMINLSTSATETTGIVRGLKPAMTYHFRVFAENRLGRSDASHSVKATTAEEAPGGPPTKVRAQPMSSQSLKITWKPPSKELHFGAIKGYYVGYRVAASSDPYIYKTLELGADGREECVLTSLSRFTQYSVIVQAYNNKGAGPPSDEVVVQTLDSDPPAPPYLQADGNSFTSVSLKWDRAPGDPNPVTGYYVRQKEAGSGGEWHETHVPGDQNSLTVDKLKCGSTYQFAVRGYNAAGTGDTSDIVTVKTSGAAPVAPDRQSLVQSNVSSAVVLLGAWHSGGCPIHQFTVKYRRRQDADWTTVQATRPRDARLEIPGLTPATWYTLQMTAHNSAGVTEAEYAFATLPKHGAADQVTPRTEVHRETSSVVSDATVVVPVVVSLVIVVVLLVVVCMVVRRKHSSGSSQSGSSLYGTRKNGMQEAMQMSDLEGKVGKECSSSAFFPAPYATTQLGTRGPEKRTDHMDEPLYATVKRTPRPPRSDGHIYQCPALARNGRPAARVT
ncbi:cell adhesion molecule Dscam1-like isoform X2 [Amblyomma americanum]